MRRLPIRRTRFCSSWLIIEVRHDRAQPGRCLCRLIGHSVLFARHIKPQDPAKGASQNRGSKRKLAPSTFETRPALAIPKNAHCNTTTGDRRSDIRASRLRRSLLSASSYRPQICQLVLLCWCSNSSGHAAGGLGVRERRSPTALRLAKKATARIPSVRKTCLRLALRG